MLNVNHAQIAAPDTRLLADACGVDAGADVSDGIASSLQAMTGDMAMQ